MSVYLSEVLGQVDVLADALPAMARDDGGLPPATLPHGLAVTWVGMGSSYFLARTAAAELRRRGVRSQARMASDLLYYPEPGDSAGAERHLFVLVSQSGRTAELLKLVTGLRRQDVVLLTNNPKSPLAASSALVLAAHAGEEPTVSSIRTFACMLVRAAAFASWLSGDSPATVYDEAGRCLREVREFLAGWEAPVSAAADQLGGVPRLGIVARGPALPTAYQAALVFQEVYHQAPAIIDGGTFRHGPVAAVGADLGSVVLAPAGPTQHLQLRCAYEIRRWQGRVVVVGPASAGDGVAHMPVMSRDGVLNALTLLPPVQLLVYLLARRAGLDPDDYGRISKVTTEE